MNTAYYDAKVLLRNICKNNYRFHRNIWIFINIIIS